METQNRTSSNVVPFTNTPSANDDCAMSGRRMLGVRQSAESCAKRADETEFARNERLRRARRMAWQRVEAALAYWNAWREMHLRIRSAMEWGIAHDLACPTDLQRMNDLDNPWILDYELLERIKGVEMKLLLMPAPDVASLEWKRKRAKHIWYQADANLPANLKGVFSEMGGRIEAAIAQDQAWLDAHPTRQAATNKARRK